MNAGAAKEMAVPAMTTNATTNVTPGSPPVSSVAVATAAAIAANDDDDDDGVNLNALCHRVRDLRRMLDASANRLAHAEGSSVDGG